MDLREIEMKLHDMKLELREIKMELRAEPSEPYYQTNTFLQFALLFPTTFTEYKNSVL